MTYILKFFCGILLFSQVVFSYECQNEPAYYVDPRRDAFGSNNNKNAKHQNIGNNNQDDKLKNENEELVSDFDDIFDRAMETCIIKERADRKDVQAIFTYILPKTKTQKCFITCWLEQFQVIHENKFRRDQYIKLATFDNPDNVTRIEIINDILNDCKIGETCQPERCELGYLIIKCIYDGAIKRKLNPKDF